MSRLGNNICFYTIVWQMSYKLLTFHYSTVKSVHPIDRHISSCWLVQSEITWVLINTARCLLFPEIESDMSTLAGSRQQRSFDKRRCFIFPYLLYDHKYCSLIIRYSSILIWRCTYRFSLFQPLIRQMNFERLFPMIYFWTKSVSRFCSKL